MSGAAPDASYWSQDAAVLRTALGSGPGGLSSEGAAAKLRLIGPNSVEECIAHERASIASAAIREPARPYPHICHCDLAGTATVGGFGHYSGSGAASTLLGFSQEYRASTAIEQLKR